MHVVVIGAGIGGLAVALRLTHAGCAVTVVERHAAPGGKIRALGSATGPVDAGPTVLTLRPVFEALFADVGARLSDHVTLVAEPVLARHFWSDGRRLDLTGEFEASAANIRAAFGAKAEGQFRRYAKRARLLFDGFDHPVMQNPTPSMSDLSRHVLRRPTLARAMMPQRSLAGQLARDFDEPRLAQLFGRYATYVGGSPYASPAILALISDAEARGVWRIEGGMHMLASAIATLAADMGATLHCDTHVESVEIEDGRAAAVVTRNGRIEADAVVFNGDPAALIAGALGRKATAALPPDAPPRSFSACVMSFAARARGLDLAHHTVLFGDAPKAEFDALAAGRLPDDPTLYICAQDRGGGVSPPDCERFEIILNAPPTSDAQIPVDKTRCQTLILDRLKRFGLTFEPEPTRDALTVPQDFEALFPSSAGSLYGQSPHGLMASFARPTAKTALAGLYLVGGGVHPGPGLPMATLSARHAAEAILADRISRSTPRRAATPGGISTG